MDRIENDETIKETKCNDTINRKLYFATYFLCFALDGFLLSFPGAIFLTLQQDLNTSILTVSWIYTSMSLGYMTATFISGYIADNFQEIHRYQSVMIFVTSICVLAIPFTTNIIVMYILFIIIGMGMGGNETNYTLFVFRLYPLRGVEMFFIACTVAIISASIIPLIIQLSISLYSTYLYSFILISLVGILHSIFVLFLKTPKHDKCRAIKRDIRDIAINKDETNQLNKLQKASFILERTNKYKNLQYLIITLLIICYTLNGSIETGLTAYITTYCNEYLQIDDKIGRYLITCYWSSELLYRIIRQIFFPNANPMNHVLCLGFIMRFLIGIFFICFGNKVIALYIIYILMGICSSPIVPGIPSWSEMVKPTTGLISCLFMFAYGAGHAIMSAIIGELVNKYTIKALPYFIIIPLIMGVLCASFAVILYKIYKSKQLKILQQIDIKQLSSTCININDGETDKYDLN